jgi:hypothetical protein
MDPIVQKMPESFVFDKGLTGEAITGKVLLSKPGIEDRRSCRHTVPQVHQSCELKVGSNVMSASLVNKSKTGFSVLIDRLEDLKVGKKVELHANMGWFTVQIVYINKVAPPKNTAPECDSWFKLGLKIKQRLQQQRLQQ